MRLPRLFGAIVSISLRRELAHRANLIFQMLLTVVDIASGLAALRIVYTQTDTLAGWTLAEAVVLLGTYQVVSGVLSTFVEPNLTWFGNQVTSGKLDSLLLKPVNSAFLATLGTCAPLGLSQVALGIAVVAIGISDLGAGPTASSIAGWLVMLGVGIAITWVSRVLVASLSFWAPQTQLDMVYEALWQFGRYPVSIYRQPLRFVLTWVLPVAFISTFPARALTGGARVELLAGGAVVGIGAVVVVRLVWDAGLRRYTSATS
ncbi:MAG: ABC-2 family transporter protein [Chloroflexota bacterium]|nr:ABC-2 family transporter protein [Chloroflexota bacterium]